MKAMFEFWNGLFHSRNYVHVVYLAVTTVLLSIMVAHFLYVDYFYSSKQEAVLRVMG